MTEKVFLFAYFTGKGEAGMKLAWSEDGLTWQDVSEKYYITPDKGLMRDPFLYLGPDGIFHLIWTTNWESQDIGYAHSSDLINWSDQCRLPVMSDIPETRNCWAPEMIFDPNSNQYVIFWASTVKGQFPETAGSSETDYNHRMWCTTTSDFKTVSKPEVFLDPGFNVIDATFHRTANGKLYLIAKNETLEPVQKNLFFCSAESPRGEFSRPSAPISGSWVEGPATLAVGDWTYVYFDRYLEKKYGAIRTKDFQIWEDASESVSFPAGARHGSIVQVSRNHLDCLLENSI